ncbi:MAG: DinB family protein [Flavobacteriaceae bacterium]
MTTSALKTSEFNVYYQRYISKLSENTELRSGFELGMQNLVEFFKAIPNEKWDYRYAPGKWSIKEILQHLIDTERIFMYRCFRIARHDNTSLSGFDQNIYVDPSQAINKSIEALLSEFRSVRESSILLLESLRDEDLCFVGRADKKALSSRAAAFTVIGHEIWHMDIIKERYL